MFARQKMRRVPPSLHTLKYGLESIEFLWIRGSGRRLRIEVNSDGRVRVFSPAGAALGQILPFVTGKAAWILRSREKVRHCVRLTWPSLPRAGDEYYWEGRLLRMEEVPGLRFSIRIEPERFLLVCPPAADSDRLARQAGLRVRAEAERLLRDRVRACLLTIPILTPGKARREGLASGLAPGLSSPQVSFRMMKRRWGSCGRDGRVVLNVRLAQLPAACADYVILHELCHLRHHHHGRAFVDLLARVVPDWKSRKKELEHFVMV
ncbi:MAG: SprT family zinc-dependent metalloprotease [Candidatus Aminicenantes bacterium]|nr:SprT family zinc-dependent metalloprotease [Candidatus Aminicenantes bacterium]